MDAEFAKRWVADLRDPANTQCTVKLHDGVGYCCLGRAAVLAGAALVPMHETEWIEAEDGTEELRLVADPKIFVIDGTQFLEEGYLVGGEGEALTSDISRRLGMWTGSGDPCAGKIAIGGVEYKSLADANDRGCTFAQIADWIEANFESL